MAVHRKEVGGRREFVWLEIDPEDAHRQVLRAGHHRTRGLRELLICSP